MEVPEPITAFVPPIKVNMFELLSVKFPCKVLYHEYDPRPNSEKEKIDPESGKKVKIPNPLSKSEQSDLFIKHYILNEFLTMLRKKYKLNLYIWRAEKGDDGILHFHILHDHFIGYIEINKIWNKIISKHGYIEQYRKNQQEIHKNGFHYRKSWDSDINEKTGKPQKRWSKSKQLAAYKKGVASNWSNPTGTTDIHAMHHIRNTRAYLAKYIAKPSDIDAKLKETVEKFKEAYNVSDIHPDDMERIRTDVIKSFSIAGNLWNLSQPLSRLKSAITDVSELVVTLFKQIQLYFPTKIYYADWCQIFKFNIREIINKNFTPLILTVKSFISSIREKYYPVENNLFSTLGIPLQLFT